MQFYHFNRRWRATYLRDNKQSIHKFILCKVQSFGRLSNELSFTTTELSCLVIKTSFSVSANFAAFASLKLFETKQTKKLDGTKTEKDFVKNSTDGDSDRVINSFFHHN